MINFFFFCANSTLLQLPFVSFRRLQISSFASLSDDAREIRIHFLNSFSFCKNLKFFKPLVTHERAATHTHLVDRCAILKKRYSWRIKNLLIIQIDNSSADQQKEHYEMWILCCCCCCCWSERWISLNQKFIGALLAILTVNRFAANIRTPKKSRCEKKHSPSEKWNQ